MSSAEMKKIRSTFKKYHAFFFIFFYVVEILEYILFFSLSIMVCSVIFRQELNNYFADRIISLFPAIKRMQPALITTSMTNDVFPTVFMRK